MWLFCRLTTCMNPLSNVLSCCWHINYQVLSWSSSVCFSLRLAMYALLVQGGHVPLCLGVEHNLWFMSMPGRWLSGCMHFVALSHASAMQCSANLVASQLSRRSGVGHHGCFMQMPQPCHGMMPCMTVSPSFCPGPILLAQKICARCCPLLLETNTGALVWQQHMSCASLTAVWKKRPCITLHTLKTSAYSAKTSDNTALLSAAGFHEIYVKLHAPYGSTLALSHCLLSVQCKDASKVPTIPKGA